MANLKNVNDRLIDINKFVREIISISAHENGSILEKANGTYVSQYPPKEIADFCNSAKEWPKDFFETLVVNKNWGAPYTYESDIRKKAMEIAATLPNKNFDELIANTERVIEYLKEQI